MKNTLIEWCHHTVNFWWGCVFATLPDGSVRQECVHCYAKMMAALFSRGKATWGAEGNRWVRKLKASEELMKLDAAARKRGVRERVFVNSMSDTFEDRRDLDEARYLLWVTCCCVTNLDVLLLTKRPENVMRLVPDEWHQHWPAHVWIGTTAGTQEAADWAVAYLLTIPARVRFLSMEPLLEAVDLRFGENQRNGPIVTSDHLHWVIVGGESGAKARPMHPDWARSLRDQCLGSGVPFFFKQWGEWLPGCQYQDRDATRFREKAQHSFDLDNHAWWVGKKLAGRRLDYREWNEFPGVKG